MRKIGNNQWLKPSVDFNEGDVVFEKARWIGSEEGNFGEYQVFQDVETKECYNIGGGQLNWLVSKLGARDVIKLKYKAYETLTSGKYKGKKTHTYECWVHDDEDVNASVRETSDEIEPASEADVNEVRSVVSGKKKTKTTKKASKAKATRAQAKPVESEESDLDELDDLE